MDLDKAREKARILRRLLDEHGPAHPELARCRESLDPLLAAIEQPGFEAPSAVPCARLFEEGGLDGVPAVRDAYAELYVVLMDIDDVPIPDD